MAGFDSFGFSIDNVIFSGTLESDVTTLSGSVTSVNNFPAVQTVSGTVSTNVDGFNDSPNLDAFGRLRVGNPYTLFESKQLFNSQSLFWSTKTETGATATHSSDTASTTLTVTGDSGSLAIRQSKQRMNYQPGKSLSSFITFEMGNGSDNVTQRVGYFDENNGIFLELDGTTLNVVLRSSVTGAPVETRIQQSSWNLDSMNGSGPSGITVDITKTQILAMDLEWLGVGRVRVGFVIGGRIYYVHQFLNSNINDTVYMSTPNLPVRYEIKSNDASSGASLQHICSTVFSEGGFETLGATRSADRGATTISIPAGGVVPVVSIRLKADHIGATIIPTDISALATTSTDYRWVLILNPVVGGTDAAAWTDVSNSAVQFDVSRTATNTLTGGTIIKSGYVAGGGGPAPASDVQAAFSSGLVLSADIDGNRDELVLGIQNISGTDSFIGGISWRELQ